MTSKGSRPVASQSARVPAGLAEFLRQVQKVARATSIGSKKKVTPEDHERWPLEGFHRLMYGQYRAVGGYFTQAILAAVFYGYIEKLFDIGYSFTGTDGRNPEFKHVVYPYYEKSSEGKETEEVMTLTGKIAKTLEEIRNSVGAHEKLYQKCEKGQGYGELLKLAFAAYKFYVTRTCKGQKNAKSGISEAKLMGLDLTVEEAVTIASEGLGVNILYFYKGQCCKAECHRCPFPSPIKIHLVVQEKDCTILYKTDNPKDFGGELQLGPRGNEVIEVVDANLWSYFTICGRILEMNKGLDGEIGDLKKELIELKGKREQIEEETDKAKNVKRGLEEDLEQKRGKCGGKLSLLVKINQTLKNYLISTAIPDLANDQLLTSETYLHMLNPPSQSSPQKPKQAELLVISENKGSKCQCCGRTDRPVVERFRDCSEECKSVMRCQRCLYIFLLGGDKSEVPVETIFPSCCADCEVNTNTLTIENIVKELSGIDDLKEEFPLNIK